MTDEYFMMQALKEAKKAYEDYGNKVGRDYANKLKYRVNIENGK